MPEESPMYHVSVDPDVTLEEFAARPCCLQFVNPLYRPPTNQEIRHLLKLLNLKGGEAARLLGLSSSKESGSRTIRKWTGGERKMPYAAWHLLLAYSGLVTLSHEILSSAKQK